MLALMVSATVSKKANRNSKPELGVIGFGVFGSFMCKQLQPYFQISVYDLKYSQNSLEEVISKPVVMLAVPVQNLETLLEEIAPKINPQALVIDISSIKVRPVKLMEKYLPKGCQIMATHPLFGPQSGKEGIAGLNIVVWPVRIEAAKYVEIKDFLSVQLQLSCWEQSPQVHDQNMAYIHALPFFIGRALANLEIPALVPKTPTYQYLEDLARVVSSDTPALFETIQLENPLAAKIRAQFLFELTQIAKELDSKSDQT